MVYKSYQLDIMVSLWTYMVSLIDMVSLKSIFDSIESFKLYSKCSILIIMPHSTHTIIL